MANLLWLRRVDAAILDFVREIEPGPSVQRVLRRRMHASIAQVGEWLQSVLRGYYQDHAVRGNFGGPVPIRQTP